MRRSKSIFDLGLLPGNGLLIGCTFIFIMQVAACNGFSQKPVVNAKPEPTPAKEQKKMSEKFLEAIRNHDRTVLDRAQQAPPGLPREIDAVVDTMDAESREIAVELVTKQDSTLSATFLLRRTADSDANIATMAVEGLSKLVVKPPAQDIISVIPSRPDPFIRSKLYLEAGKLREDGVLEQLRRAAANEQDADVKLHSLAARAKQGGGPEAAEFTELVKQTEPDDALKMQDLLLYIGRQDLAKGLITWLDNNEGVMRLGSDRQNSEARMCDVAVWTVHLLNITLPFETTHLRNFEPDEIEQVRKILSTL
jgi:hypothetical protein